MKTHSLTRRLIGGVLTAEFLCVASFAIVAIRMRCMAGAERSM